MRKSQLHFKQINITEEEFNDMKHICKGLCVGRHAMDLLPVLINHISSFGDSLLVFKIKKIRFDEMFHSFISVDAVSTNKLLDITDVTFIVTAKNIIAKVSSERDDKCRFFEGINQ